MAVTAVVAVDRSRRAARRALAVVAAVVAEAAVAVAAEADQAANELFILNVPLLLEKYYLSVFESTSIMTFLVLLLFVRRVCCQPAIPEYETIGMVIVTSNSVNFTSRFPFSTLILEAEQTPRSLRLCSGSGKKLRWGCDESTLCSQVCFACMQHTIKRRLN